MAEEKEMKLHIVVTTFENFPFLLKKNEQTKHIVDELKRIDEILGEECCELCKKKYGKCKQRESEYCEIRFNVIGKYLEELQAKHSVDEFIDIHLDEYRTAIIAKEPFIAIERIDCELFAVESSEITITISSNAKLVLAEVEEIFEKLLSRN